MNLRRGFRRITLFLSIVASVFCGYIALGIVLEEFEMGWFWGVLAGLGGIAFGYCFIWLFYKLIEWFVLGFCDIESRSKGRNEAINLKRGFIRITLVLAVLAAIFSAGLCASIVINKHDSAQGYLWQKQRAYREIYAQAAQGQLSLPKSGRLDLGDLVLEVKLDKAESLFEDQKGHWKVLLDAAKTGSTNQEFFEFFAKYNKTKLKELEDGFWVNLSKGSLVGLCILAGLAGAGVGFGAVWLGCCVMWLFYLLIRWVVLGFCSDRNEI